MISLSGEHALLPKFNILFGDIAQNLYILYKGIVFICVLW